MQLIRADFLTKALRHEGFSLCALHLRKKKIFGVFAYATVGAFAIVTTILALNRAIPANYFMRGQAAQKGPTHLSRHPSAGGRCAG